MNAQLFCNDRYESCGAEISRAEKLSLTASLLYLEEGVGSYGYSSEGVDSYGYSSAGVSYSSERRSLIKNRASCEM